MKIANIINNSTAEVKGCFADVIYFQGCNRNCSYCFNPELKDFSKGEDVLLGSIYGSLSEMSDVVVLTGGEPLCQDKKELYELIVFIRHVMFKYVLLETSYYDDMIWKECNKVLYCIKPDDRDIETWVHVGGINNVIPVVVLGKDQPNVDNLELVLGCLYQPIYVRFENDIEDPLIISKYYESFKRGNRKWRVFKKSWI